MKIKACFKKAARFADKICDCFLFGSEKQKSFSVKR